MQGESALGFYRFCAFSTVNQCEGRSVGCKISFVLFVIMGNYLEELV